MTSQEATPVGVRSILGIADFRRIWAAQAISDLGDRPHQPHPLHRRPPADRLHGRHRAHGHRHRRADDRHRPHRRRLRRPLGSTSGHARLGPAPGRDRARLPPRPVGRSAVDPVCPGDRARRGRDVLHPRPDGPCAPDRSRRRAVGGQLAGPDHPRHRRRAGGRRRRACWPVLPRSPGPRSLSTRRRSSCRSSLFILGVRTSGKVAPAAAAAAKEAGVGRSLRDGLVLVGRSRLLMGCMIGAGVTMLGPRRGQRPVRAVLRQRPGRAGDVARRGRHRPDAAR